MLYRIIRALLIRLVCAVYDLYEFARDFWDVNLLGRHKVIRRFSGMPIEELKRERRIAIVAIYPSLYGWPFTFHLLGALKFHGFKILVISTRTLTDENRNDLLSCASSIIERLPVGRDFGSYRMGLEQLGFLNEDGQGACEELILANDSMFYRADTTDLLAEMLPAPQDVYALFENYEARYHAQAFFLIFSKKGFGNTAFKTFWKNYKPYSSRRHSIDHGECGLSRALLRSPATIGAHFNSVRVRKIFQTLTAAESRSVLLDLLPNGFGDIRKSFAERIENAIIFEHSNLTKLTKEPESQKGQYSRPAERDAAPDERELSASSDDEFTKLVNWKLANGLVSIAEKRNPTHGLALFLNKYGKAPLKRDLSYRGAYDIAQVIENATGFLPENYEFMEGDLRRRGLYCSLRLLQRALFALGRI